MSELSRRLSKGCLKKGRFVCVSVSFFLTVMFEFFGWGHGDIRKSKIYLHRGSVPKNLNLPSKLVLSFGVLQFRFRSVVELRAGFIVFRLSGSTSKMNSF